MAERGKQKLKSEKQSRTTGSQKKAPPKKKYSTKAEMERFSRRPVPNAIRKALQDQFPIAVPGCKPAVQALGAALNEGCSLRSEFVVEAQRGCITSPTPGSVLVDLVILIDTSSSMGDEALELSDAAGVAVEAAQQSCPSDLRVCWFGIEWVWENTRFTQSYRDYLQGQISSNKEDCTYSGTPVADSDIRGYIADREDGAAAIMDIAEHFDWRSGASRAVFYLGDEALERGGPQDASDYAAADAAIAVAQERGVTVFTYFGTPNYPDSAAETSAEYRRVAAETGGQFFNAPANNLGGFQAILEQIICTAGSNACSDVNLPNVRPCFSLMWGDGPNDRIETNDIELMCISAVNPYSNITFKNLTLLVTMVTEEGGGDVEDLPDRTPSVYVKPLYVTCFGDIPPCNPEDPDSSRVTREIVLVSSGAKEGKYSLYIVYCYSIEFTYLDLDWYEIDLVKS